jgi:peptide chain release factor 2
MVEGVFERIENLRERIGALEVAFDLYGKVRELGRLEELSQEPDFWNDAKVAAKTLKHQAALKRVVSEMKAIRGLMDDAEVLATMAQEERDNSQDGEISGLVEKGEAEVNRLELMRMLSGEHDAGNAFLVINAGAGGTESQDWAGMLMRMYLRFCDRQGWKASIFDEQPGEEAGIKSTTVLIEGENAFGFLKAEIGIHRLVRLSPFDAAHRRHTSFAGVFVYPEVDDDINIEIEDKDIRIDIFRASGAGGQKVNKTSSAIRITHIPTNIVVQCQNERSQHKNKDMAMAVLKSRLYDLEQSKKDEEKSKIESTKQRINFGSQIRSYVLQPYRMVKDHRTGFTVGNADGVLDGDLSAFIQAFLMRRSDDPIPTDSDDI